MESLSDIFAPLTSQERIFVGSVLKGSTKIAAATAAGYLTPKNAAYTVPNNRNVKAALIAGREAFAKEVDFSRRKAHEMLMDAHRNAADTNEQVMAIRELIKLHGVAAAEKKEILHKHAGEVTLNTMTDAELAKIADMGETLSAEYHEVGETECLPAPNAA